MRGRAVLLITTMTVALLVASGVALAADMACPNIGNLCIGTNNADTMTGTNQADVMKGRGGADTMQAHGGGDRLFGGGGNDEVSAGSGKDSLVGDSLAEDTLVGIAGDDFLSGGYGNDTYFFSEGWGADRIAADGEEAGMGTDSLDFSLLSRPLDVDLVSSPDRDEVFSVLSGAGMLNFPAMVKIENVTGGNKRDVVRGNDAPNVFSGEDGNDSLYGREGNDVLTGGLGADALSGGPNDDTLEGGVDSDIYLFQDDWGLDSITDAAPGTDRLFLGELTRSVTVELASGKAYESAFGSFELSPNSVNWTPGAINSVTGGTSDDTIDVADGDVGDTVDCGPGTDTVTVDVVEDLSGNTVEVDAYDANTCETVNEVVIT